MSNRSQAALDALDALGDVLNKLNEADGLYAQAHTGGVWEGAERAFREGLRLYLGGPAAAQSVWEIWLDNNAERVSTLIREYVTGQEVDVR